MVIVRLFGGLGNQLFQYALGRRIAIEKKMPLKLDIKSGFKGDFYGREYSLYHFNICENFAETKELPKFRLPHTESVKLNGKLIRFINRLLPFNKGFEIHERSFKFDKSVFEKRDKYYLIGYWQNEKYFDSIRDILLDDLTLKVPLSNKSLDVSKLISSSNSVGLHIRRYQGNIKNSTLSKHQNIHGILSLSYYKNAIELMTKKLEKPHFFIFSDDHEWVLENFPFQVPHTFVFHNSDKKNYEDLALLSYCKHQIIANSSFSWWAAWLNRNSNKIVIAPKNWFAAKYSNSEIVPPDWIKI